MPAERIRTALNEDPMHNVTIYVAPWKGDSRVPWNEALIHIVVGIVVGGHEFKHAGKRSNMHIRIRADTFLIAYFDGLDPDDLAAWAAERDPGQYLDDTRIEDGRLAIAVRTVNVVERVER